MANVFPSYISLILSSILLISVILRSSLLLMVFRQCTFNILLKAPVLEDFRFFFPITRLFTLFCTKPKNLRGGVRVANPPSRSHNFFHTQYEFYTPINNFM